MQTLSDDDAEKVGPVCARSTDRELWREVPGDYYTPSIHVNCNRGIGINVGGMVYVMPVREWHALAKCTPRPYEISEAVGVPATECRHDPDYLGMDGDRVVCDACGSVLSAPPDHRTGTPRATDDVRLKEWKVAVLKWIVAMKAQPTNDMELPDNAVLRLLAVVEANAKDPLIAEIARLRSREELAAGVVEAAGALACCTQDLLIDAKSGIEGTIDRIVSDAEAESRLSYHAEVRHRLEEPLNQKYALVKNTWDAIAAFDAGGGEKSS